MKKIFLVALLSVMLGLSLSASLSVEALSDAADGHVADTDYIKKAFDFASVDFESLGEGKFTTNQATGVYIQTAAGDFTANTVTPISGNKSLHVEFSSEPWVLNLFTLEGAGSHDLVGVYFVSFDVRPQVASVLSCEVRSGWDNGVSNFLADFRLAVTYDANGVAQSVEKDTQGWTGADQQYGNERIRVVDGVVQCYFEFEVDESEAALLAANQFLPQISFMVANPAGTKSILDYDNLRFGEAGSEKIFKLSWNTNIDDLQDSGQIFDVQPIWGNEIMYSSAEEALEGDTSIKLVSGVTANGQIGGFEQRMAHVDGKKFIKNAGLNYIQYDIDVVDCSMLNIWTLGTYTAIVYQDGVWHSEGSVSGFKAQDMGNCYRLSYYIDFNNDNMNMDFNINTTSASGGYILIDNFIVASENYAPYVKDDGLSYDLVDTLDVEVALDLKDRDFSKVALFEGADLVRDTDYTYADNQVVLKSALFSEHLDEYKFVVYSTGGGTLVKVAKNDNRTAISEIVASKAIEKVYDATTQASLSGVSLVLTGVKAGDEVSASGDVAYETSAVGNSVKVFLTNIVLAGKDKDKYKCTLDNVELAGKINKVQLTVSAPSGDVTKVYDGSVDAGLIRGTVSGIVNEEVVEVAILSVYNSKDVAGANKISVTYTISGEKAGNYLAPVALEITEGVSISKKALTVVADAKTKSKGQTDPALTYQATGLVLNDTLSGALSRAAGEDQGEYDITIGSLANANYEITYTKATLTISAAATTVAPTEAPTTAPTAAPTQAPTTAPTQAPTQTPTSTGKSGGKTGCFGVVTTGIISILTMVSLAAGILLRKKESK